MNPGGPAGPLPKVIPSDVIPAFAYGRKSRPSTPINNVVGNQYGCECQEALESTYEMYQRHADASGGKLYVKHNKASKTSIANARDRRDQSLHMSEPKELFKLTKFKKVSSRLQLAPLGHS